MYPRQKSACFICFFFFFNCSFFSGHHLSDPQCVKISAGNVPIVSSVCKFACHPVHLTSCSSALGQPSTNPADYNTRSLKVQLSLNFVSSLSAVHYYEIFDMQHWRSEFCLHLLERETAQTLSLRSNCPRCRTTSAACSLLFCTRRLFARAGCSFDLFRRIQPCLRA
jgi:hypothetical protein